MPGYWNTDDAREREAGERRQERRQGASDTRGGDDRQGGGAQRRQASQQARLNRIRREAEARNKKQQEINARNKDAADKRASEMAAIAKRQQEEKGIDIYGKTIKEVGGRKATTTSAQDYYGDVQGTVDLANRLRAEGKDQNDPSLTQEERDALGRLQFSQDEGVYGGVSGMEAEVNKMKKAILEGGAGYNEALAGLTRLSGGNEELAKVSALGVQEYLRRKTKGNYQQQEDILSGKTQIEGLSPDFFKTFTGQTAGVGTTYYDKKTGKVVKEGDPNAQLGLWGDAMGYDPSGQFSWSTIESTPTLYDKYLNRGKNWYDPISGLFPKYPSGYGAGTGGGGGWGGYGGYGGGGGGGYGGYGYGPQPRQNPQDMANYYTRQANLQQAMVGQHMTGAGTGFRKSRGGIVSLLELRS